MPDIPTEFSAMMSARRTYDADDEAKARIDAENARYAKAQAERKGIDTTKLALEERLVGKMGGTVKAKRAKPVHRHNRVMPDAPLPTDHDLREGYDEAYAKLIPKPEPEPDKSYDSRYNDLAAELDALRNSLDRCVGYLEKLAPQSSMSNAELLALLRTRLRT